MNLKPKRPLAIHIILQDGESKSHNPARRLASELYARLARGVRPTGIPVHLWVGRSQPSGAVAIPPQPPLAEAARNEIILLIDQPFFDVRKQWQDYLRRLSDSLVPERDLLLPVSICSDAHRTAHVLNDLNCVPVRNPETVFEDERVFQAIFKALLQLLPELGSDRDLKKSASPVANGPRVFLCHAKSDGDTLARRIRQHIYEETQLECFFDIYDIPHGRAVKEFIQTSISKSCLLVIWTDQLLESRWCQFEILEARRQQRSVVVLDAINSQAPRIFPFLGNMPVVRWRERPELVVSALLLELVRTQHVRALFEALRGRDVTALGFMLHPPDLLEASRVFEVSKKPDQPPLSTNELFVYPDPPLPAEELMFLAETFSNLCLYSLSEWTALRAAHALSKERKPPSARPAPLSGLSIGLSISEAENWAEYGLINEHQDDLALDISRALILLGARLLWGGDLRPEGLGTRLENVVRAYHQSDHAPQDHIACYLAWPKHENVDRSDIQKRRAFADVVLQERPNVADSYPEAFNAICYSLMRRRIAADSNARIVLGGRTNGYAGRYPGVVEEALETIKLERPIYIVGGFGGAARAVYDAIANPEGTSSLRDAWQTRCMDRKVREMLAFYQQLGKQLNPELTVDHDAMLESLQGLGLDRLSRMNRLSAAENERLARSQDIHEILALLVKGLSQLPRPFRDADR